MARMTDSDLAALLAAEIDDAESYDEAELAGHRERALRYYQGDMFDTPAQEGRSSVVSHDVADTIGWVMPSLMRVFASSDRIVVYEPQQPGDEEAAKQATDYVNYVVMRECHGYRVLWDVFHDALLHRNGILKHYWDTTPEISVHIMRGLTEDQMTELLADDEVEVIEHEAYEEPPDVPPELAGMMEGLPVEEMLAQLPPEQAQQIQAAFQPVVYHNLKIRRTCKYGKLAVEAIPPEEFLISRNATSVEDARFVAHKVRRTRSELIEMGYDKDVVEDLPAFATSVTKADYLARHGSLSSNVGFDKSTDEIEVFEAYLKADTDGDGVAETVRIIAAGKGETEILEWEVWEEDVPFSDLTPERIPHRWEGRSIADDTMDIQRIKTVLMRQNLDNLYLRNHPQREVDIDRVQNPDELANPTLGGFIMVKGGLGAVREVVHPDLSGTVYQALEYQDMIREMRTGVSRASMALDPEALQNQTATAVSLRQAASYSKVELIARNFAEMGLSRAFRCILKIIVKNQDRTRTIRLRDKWIEVDPRAWNAHMDVTINVGLGSGSRDRDLAMLSAILADQMMAAQMLGPQNPVSLKMLPLIRNTLAKKVETAGLRAPEQYFPEISDEDMQAIQQQMAEQSQNDPKMKEAQARMQMEQMKLQADQAKSQAQMQMEAQKLQAQMQADAQRMQMEAETRRQQIMLDLDVKREQLREEMTLKREQLAAELRLREEQMAAELQLKRELGLAANLQKGMATNPVQLGGDPG